MSTIPNEFFTIGCRLCFVDGKIYLVGGRGHSVHGREGRLVTEYNPCTNTWRSMPILQQRRSPVHSSVCSVDTKIFVVAGNDKTASCEMLDLSEEYPKWRYIAAMNRSHKGGGIVPFDKKVYVLGGHRNTSVEVYDADKGKKMFQLNL